MGKENTNGNDPWGYRIDATAMLIGMMDMDGSRIAIVPFAHVPGKPADIIDFTNVSDASDRIELIGKVYDLKGNVLQPNTNIGSALMKAEQMLLSREDQSNRPMIVLMTDGRNDFSSTENGQDTVPSSLRWKDGQIVDEGTVTHFTKEMADMVTREAVDCAISNNIPIYTVALGQNTATDVATPYGVSLMQISQETGAMECQKVNKEEAYDLPTFFAEILANQIGSSVKRAAEPVPVPDQPGTYEVKIPILNKEVLETNIILPVRALNQTQRRGSFSNINANSIELYDSDGNRKIDNSKEVVILNNFNFNHFVIVKIRKPDRPGMWTLRFKSDTIPNEISFNILYKYSIKYAVDEITNDHNNTELYKTDTLIMNARFVDGNGIPVNDSALYQDHTSDEAYEDWMTIRAYWKLYQTAADGSIMGTPVREGMLNNNSELNVFSTTINLAEGGNLKSGNYKLVVSAVGAGLDRTVEYPLTLKNHAPSRLMDQYQTTINVNSPEKNNDDTWKADKMSGNLEKKLSDIIVDQDNDDIKYQLQPVDDAKSYAVMTLEGDTIHYNLIQDGDKVKSGKAEYKLIYDDMDNGGRGEASITLTIYSMVDAMLQDYSLEVKTDGKNTGAGEDTYLKNTPVTITAKLKNNDGTYLTGDSLETLKRQILILDQNGESVAFDAKLEVNEEKDGLEYTVETTGNKKAEWTVTINIDPFESITKVIQIPNDNSPVAMESSEVTINCDGEKVPSFLASIIGENTPEDDPSRSAVIKGMFTDADCDEMVYSSPVFRDPATGEESDSNIISATKEGDGEAAIYTIHVSGEATSLFNYTMNREMHITATDGDGNTGVYVRKITIVDLYKKMITYLLITHHIGILHADSFWQRKSRLDFGFVIGIFTKQPIRDIHPRKVIILLRIRRNVIQCIARIIPGNITIIPLIIDIDHIPGVFRTKCDITLYSEMPQGQ